MTETLLGVLPNDVLFWLALACQLTVLGCVGPVVYWTWRRDPQRGHPKPVTWGYWWLAGSVATVGLFLGGAPFNAWGYKAALSAGPFVVAAVALYRGAALRFTRTDWRAIILTGIAVLIYIPLYFGWIGPPDPYVAGVVVVLMLMVVDSLACWPTWRQAYTDPQEPSITYEIALAATIVTLAIMPIPWTFLSVGIFVFLGLQMISIIVALRLGRARQRRAALNAHPVLG